MDVIPAVEQDNVYKFDYYAGRVHVTDSIVPHIDKQLRELFPKAF